MRSVFSVILGMAISFAPIWAAPASDDTEIDAILASPAVTWDQAVWLVGRTVGTFDETVTSANAVAKAPPNWTPGTRPSRVDAATYAFLLLQALNIPGGVMETVFPSPRYAFRELVYRRIFPAGQAPDEAVTGQEALMYLQNAQGWKEARS